MRVSLGQKEASSTYGSESCLQEISHRGGGAFCLCVDVLDTSKLEKTLGSGCSDDTGTPGCRDKATHNRTDLAANLGWHGVRLSKSSTPVTPANRNDRELGKDDGTTDSGSDFLCAFNTETNVSVKVADGDKCFEAGALTGARLLLHRHDLHDFILEFWQEIVDDLELLDRERKEVDLFHRLDLSVFHETSELGDGNPSQQSTIALSWENISAPFFLLVLASATAGTPASTSSVTTSTSKSSSSSGSVSHC